MASAEVGDDVFGEDPTVRLLEEESAEAVGMAAAIFMPTGTMANQVALHLLGRPGGEVLCEARSHIVLHEMAAMAVLSGLQPLPLESPSGALEPEAVEEALGRGGYGAPTVLLSLENTHNMAGGRVFRPSRLLDLIHIARNHNLPIHLDGARIFNAACALGLAVSDLTAGFDTVMFCLSKGLGAPVGSMLCGGKDLVGEARRVRKMFGGGLHQAGVLAAAGLVALREGPQLLAADHENARHLAQGLAEVPGIELDPALVETNIVIFELTDRSAPTFCRRLEGEGVLAIPFGGQRVRMVTHRDLNRADIDRTLLAVSHLVPDMHSMHS